MIFYGFCIPLCSSANSPSINDCSWLCRFAFLRFIVISSSLVKPINYPVKCSRAAASARCRHFYGTFNDHLRSIFFTLSLAKQHRGKRQAHEFSFHFHQHAIFSSLYAFYLNVHLSRLPHSWTCVKLQRHPSNWPCPKLMSTDPTLLHLPMVFHAAYCSGFSGVHLDWLTSELTIKKPRCTWLIAHYIAHLNFIFMCLFFPDAYVPVEEGGALTTEMELLSGY